VTPIHDAAATGFSRAAAEYARGRPGYPPEALALLAERLSLGPGRTVLDLAAGTGALTRPLAETGAEVIAVEPVAEMRAALPAGVRALDGTAEPSRSATLRWTP
jgi:2-polyprenyl-3-methyl-5-hydroxy-6-metoxy-1,4-benzoquinol methylase